MQNDLSRFHKAQETDYKIALREIQNGRKRSHWMWYIFPQLKGLGHSGMAEYYGISGIEEAKAYLKDPVLGARLLEISKALLKIECDDPRIVMGYPDNLKLKSCMTLFAEADPETDIFQSVLNKFFNGEKDTLTLSLLEREEK
ncbi:MAG: DUF1810 domain-containing protein [Solobacterium sp.]|nr:DUF1810 domain-containing protein [Solobacterium sp.]